MGLCPSRDYGAAAKVCDGLERCSLAVIEHHHRIILNRLATQHVDPVRKMRPGFHSAGMFDTSSLASMKQSQLG